MSKLPPLSLDRPGSEGHVPVMLHEVMDQLAPQQGDVIIDGTFGGGGYTEALLRTSASTVIAIDRDPAAKPRAEALSLKYPGKLKFAHSTFGRLDQVATDLGYSTVHGVVLDLGVSSFQLDEAERGFSFAKNGPLDMRMGNEGLSAKDLVNTLDESALTKIIRDYGEERHALRIARAIVKVRIDRPFETTFDLASLVRKCLPAKKKNEIDPATRTFQALRIAVNHELDELESALLAAERILAPGGRLVVVSFHSLEDRPVKTFLRVRSGNTPNPSRFTPEATTKQKPSFTLSIRKALVATDEEATKNPRARSAKLRVALRTDAPVWTTLGGHHG